MTTMPPLRRAFAVFVGLAAFGLVIVSAWDAIGRAIDDNAAGPALVGFIVALTPALIATYVMIEALHQAIDGKSRTAQMLIGMTLALAILATVPTLVDAISNYSD